jgi:hypothetical protein
MARFCTQCGTPAANDQVKFCSKCGAQLPSATPAEAQPASQAQASAQPAASPSPAAPTPAPPPAAAPVAPVPAVGAPAAKGSSAWIKIVVGILAFFIFVGALGIATCAYVGYRVKKRVDQAKAEYGLNNTGPTAQERDVCSLITKEEVAQFTGVDVASAEGTTAKCDYTSADNSLVLENDVSWSGGKLGLKLGVMALKNMAGQNTFVQVPGIGDEAYTIALDAKTAEDMQKQAQSDQTGTVSGIQHVMGMAPLMFRKADVMVTVRVARAEDPESAKQSIAKVVASRL